MFLSSLRTRLNTSITAQASALFVLFGYNNLHYELAGQTIEHLSGQSCFEFVQSHLLKLIGLNRISFQTPPKDTEDVTVCHNALNDASVAPVNYLWMGDEWYGAASGDARSPAKDLVKLYGSYRKGFNNKFQGDTSTSQESTFKQLTYIMSAKISFDQPSQFEASYCFGWGRVQLPGHLSQIGINPVLRPKGMPIVSKGTSKLVLFHQGSLPGFLAIAALLPEFESAVVVPTNSLALNDKAGWIGQLIIVEFLEVSSDLKTLCDSGGGGRC
ncbi:hypothetical protein ACHAPQ_009723 [Fusarium lateritium]